MLLIRFHLFFLLVFCSCITEPGIYDRQADNGTYTGSTSVYGGPGINPDTIDRVCPDITTTLTIDDDKGSFLATDSYPNYVHVGAVITTHSSTVSIFDNNKFSTESHWAIEETDVQLEDLMNLGVCSSSSPSVPGDASTGERGLLRDFSLQVDQDTGFVGEFGEGKARGTLIYGVRCTDGDFIPVCVYFMQMNKTI